MQSKLEQLKAFTTVVADTGDIDAIAKYQPQDATTNPSLILQAVQFPFYASFIDESISYAKNQSGILSQQLEDAADKLAVKIGTEILKLVPGRISTEVDARLSYDTQACILRARKLIALYEEEGIDKSRILIKLASTWEGIRAAEQLEKEGINCNLTLLFSFAQAKACAQANVYLISPFVGRILDWHKAKEQRDFAADQDPGVTSVTQIYHYFKQYDYSTIVMGASFRNQEQILELAGCDRLTISPALLKQLDESKGIVERKLKPMTTNRAKPEPLTQAQFLWEHNQDAMAVDKLAEGIRNFAIDQDKLESLLQEKILG